VPPHLTATDLEMGIRFSDPSLLLFLSLLLSIPMLIYATLFFPEFKQLAPGGRRGHLSRKTKSANANSEFLIEYLLPTTSAATIALMFGMFIGVSRPMCLMLMGATAVLIGGVAFTLLEMHGLALPEDVSARYDFLDPNRCAELRLRAQQQILVNQSAHESDPCPHHEYYPESAGEDQGQRTSHLPGSTPFFEVQDISIMWRIKCLTEALRFRKSNRGPVGVKLSSKTRLAHSSSCKV
jgi:hypothetical protein